MLESFAEMDLLLDLRCLQGPHYAERGIGRHSLNLLRQAPRARGDQVTALVDPRLPALSGEVRGLVDRVRQTDYTGALSRATCFVQFSPMTHNPLFHARLLQNPSVFKAAVVYDFIPYDHPEHFLRNSTDRLLYYSSMYWLSHYDLFAPISHPVAARLKEIAQVDNSRITVTGAPLDPSFERNAIGGAGTHILVVGGDWRKNPECVVRGHARSSKLQSQRVLLVLTGAYSTHSYGTLRELARRSGGDPDLIRVVAHLSNEELLTLYRDALCVAVPSRAEGFSLPVIEAMASGVPVVASRIPVHEELVADEELLFQPEDDVKLAAAMEQVIFDPRKRASVIASQANTWPHFRAAAVGYRFWAALGERMRLRSLEAPAVVRGRRPRIAMLSPLPPDGAGVADHTMASLPGLALKAELHLFSETKAPLPVPNGVAVRPLSVLPHLASSFDRVISVIGNSHFHTAVFNAMLKFGGAVIAHDARMPDFYWYHLGHRHALEQAERELGRPVHADEIERWLAEPGSLETMFFGEIAQVAEPVCVHSSTTAALLERQYRVAATHLPFCVLRDWEAKDLSRERRLAARARLGVVSDEISIVSFGHVHYTKAPEDCIWAVEILRGWNIPATLTFVGAPHMDLEPLQCLAQRIGIGAHVHFCAQYADQATYRGWLQAADVAVQLRTMTLGNISAALMDCVTAGLPTVASRDLADALDSPGYVSRVPDLFSPILVAEAIAEIVEAGSFRQRPEPTRRAYVADHNPDVYASRLLAAMGLDAP
jgi:glycosyltransferase involved in cell wall biosynthesis